MTKEMKVQLELSAKDSASKVLRQANKTVEQAFKDAERAAQQSGNKQAQAAQQAASATQAANKRIEQSYRNARKVATELSTARERLGVRSENAIQREIDQTRDAYNRLKRSGLASQNELRRATEATKQRVKELNTELGRSSFGDKARSAMGVVAGAAAGFAVTKPKMMAAAEYDMALARVADTGYSGGSIEEKTKGKDKIHNAIKSSITQYGGTKEDALSAINEMMSKSKVSVEDALELLPIIQKNSTATGASAGELTQMLNSMLAFGVKKEEIQLAFDYMNASGKAGGFELKDMAQYFPQILASAGQNGLNGLEDLKKVGISLQQVYGVSGGASETATNLNNYYAKVKAGSTQDNIEDIEFTDAKGKKQYIDMKKSMKHYMLQGQNAAEALLSIIGDVLKNDKEYQSLLKEYQAMPEGDRKAMMQKVSKYIEGTKVAEIMPDLQAGASTYAMLNDDLTKGNVQGQYKIVDKGGYNEESFKWFSGQNGFAFEVAKNTHEMTQLENFQKINDMAAEVAKGYSSLAQDFPNLHSALVGATDAVIAFGTALAASSVVDMLGGKTKGTGPLIKNAKELAVGGGATAAGAGLFTKLSVLGFALTPTEANKGEQKAIDARFEEMKKNGNMYLFPKANKADDGKGVSNAVNNIQGTISQELRPKINSATNTLSQYQADFHAFGQSISASLEAGLASQSHTIANQITVELDGRIIAEQVSEQQFNFSKRMA